MSQLVHHGNVPYDLALTEARQHATSRFESRIESGRFEGETIIEQILASTPADRIGPVSKMGFELDDEKRLLVTIADTTQRLHANGLSGLAERLSVPVGYLKGLIGDEGELPVFALETLRKLADTRNPRVLCRAVDDEIRAVLSDAYRRLDTRILIDAAGRAFARVGAVPTGGNCDDLRWRITAVLGRVIFLADGDPVLIGAELRGSDFGVGAIDALWSVERLWCTNRATRASMMRQVHLGRKLGDDEAYSAQTYALDSRATASALYDTVVNRMHPDAIAAQVAVLDRAAKEKLSPERVRALFRDATKTKAEFEAVEAIYTNVEDINVLPPGPTIWRASNALSWVAGKTTDLTRRMELEEAAGFLLSAKAA